MMQLLLHTSLNIAGHNVRYKLYFDPRERKYFFKPEEVTLRYPSFFVWKRQAQWQFEPLSDEGLRQQALDALKEVSLDKATQ
ncbi:MAG: hypothetical protein EOO11_15815 [Chitinophagaceae bacterium]|nr:MAG: hypothetical protein EOO11_15815 [Chitinophagaceae bacterium]